MDIYAKYPYSGNMMPDEDGKPNRDTQISFRRLSACDKAEALALVAAGGLRPEYILDADSRYWGAFADQQLVGLIGCEYEGEFALLRSAIVDSAWRSRSLAARLTRLLLQDARAAGVAAVYLFSTDAGSYWIKQGFMPVPVQELVEHLPNAPQVRLFARIGWLPTEVAYKMILEGDDKLMIP
jgi:type IV secretory pathway protease TraF